MPGTTMATCSAVSSGPKTSATRPSPDGSKTMKCRLGSSNSQQLLQPRVVLGDALGAQPLRSRALIAAALAA